MGVTRGWLPQRAGLPPLTVVGLLPRYPLPHARMGIFNYKNCLISATSLHHCKLESTLGENCMMLDEIILQHDRWTDGWRVKTIPIIVLSKTDTQLTRLPVSE